MYIVVGYELLLRYIVGYYKRASKD